MEDAVSFLERAREIYPDVTSILNTNQLLCLEFSPGEPFPSESVNEQFIRLAEAFFFTKFSRDQAKSALRVALLEPRSRGKEWDVVAEEKIIDCLETVGIRLRRLAVRKVKGGWTGSGSGR